MKVNWRKLRNKIPSRVQIASSVFYKVVWVREFYPNDRFGETDFQNRQILLRLDMSDKETVTTFLHECMHAFSNEYSMGLTERQILSSEAGFYYILKHRNLFK